MAPMAHMEVIAMVLQVIAIALLVPISVKIVLMHALQSFVAAVSSDE
jgi:hypothetical protein